MRDQRSRSPISMSKDVRFGSGETGLRGRGGGSERLSRRSKARGKKVEASFS